MGFVIVLVIFLIVIILILTMGSTSSKQAVLNTVGLDLSESAKRRSVERDKINDAQLQINSAKSYVEYNYPNEYKDKLNRLIWIKKAINNEFEEIIYPNGLIEKGWHFGDNDEIQDICNKILDEKIKKLQNAI